jgi:hypothetical protein
MVYHGEETPPLEGSAEAGARYRLSRAAAVQARFAESRAPSLQDVVGRASAGEICGGGDMVYHGGRPAYNLIE